MDNYKHLLEFLRHPRVDSNIYVVKRTWAKKKTACFCGTYAVRPLQKKYMNQKVKQEV